MLAVHRWGAAGARAITKRLGCAAAAGLATGLVAGGIVVALRGTPWALWAGGADYAPIIQALQADNLNNVLAHYPPLFPALLGAWSDISGKPLAYALQDLQVVGTALFGPAAYLAWRMVLPPPWALAVGVVAMLPFIEPVKPYPQITLIMFIPVAVALVRKVRHSASLTPPRAILAGVGFGLVLGMLFLLYSGWFIWCAPGLLVATALVLPWRKGLKPALLLCASTLAVFLAVAWVHLRGLFNETGGLSDAYFYWDTCTDPAYIAMWRNDRPFGAGDVWPPIGELGGVGLFTVLLAAGAGVALLLAWRRTVVIAIGFSILGAWLIRMWLASEMYATETVRLYPRTTMVVLYGLLLLAGLAVYFAAAAIGRQLSRRDTNAGDSVPSESGAGDRGAPDGGPEVTRGGAPTAILLIPLLFLFAAAGSATIDRYMPSQRQDGNGFFAWIAQTVPTLEGACSPYAKEMCDAAPIYDETPQCGPGLPPPTRPRSMRQPEQPEPSFSATRYGSDDLGSGFKTAPR
jgi:galactan 5-O-arabinofuranosyltransferase